MQSELKPCPFCGSAGMIENARGSYGYYPEKLRVRCSDEGCHGQTGWFNHGERDYDETPVAKSKAIIAWNTRTRLTQPPRAVEEQVKGLREKWAALDKALADNIIETDQTHRVRWKGEWHCGPLADAYFAMTSVVRKLARQALAGAKP